VEAQFGALADSPRLPHYILAALVTRLLVLSRKSATTSSTLKRAIELESGLSHLLA
jgi:hypothetical protein